MSTVGGKVPWPKVDCQNQHCRVQPERVTQEPENHPVQYVPGVESINGHKVPKVHRQRGYAPTAKPTYARELTSRRTIRPGKRSDGRPGLYSLVDGSLTRKALREMS